MNSAQQTLDLGDSDRRAVHGTVASLVRCSCSADTLCFAARLIHGDYRRAAERRDAPAMRRIEDAWTAHRRAAGCVTAHAVRCIPRTDVDPYSPNNAVRVK